MDRRGTKRKAFTRRLRFEVSAVGVGETENTIPQAQAVDISSQGLGHVCACSLVKGMVVSLDLPVAGAGTTLPVLAEVAWSHHANSEFRAGFRYLMPFVCPSRQ